ncbi:hypothetical protein KY092_16330 [Natronomonas gomsonensis]|uniref:PseG/SpsG family protein n=1 Tax=Natronomonas gomsonensis TaxID=1046043 RepID=UPI00227CDFD7|nr:hypothetical protein [Natronomonas gomsonensis]MCY4732129.1 hypothetical protein [Natronomonas gomsonensis]
MEIAIRADGSNKIGYGHLTRSNAIATELLDFGESVTYLSKNPDSVVSVCADQVDICPLECGTPDEVASKLRIIDADVAYIDLPEAPFKLQRAIRDVCPLGVFLGSARNRLCCDMLVNGHLFAKEEEYEWTEEPIWCLGPDYLPLRQPFPEIATRRKDCNETPERGLILMGGTDPHNITPAAMDAFNPINIQVTVILGPGNENGSSIKQKKESLSSDFLIKRDPDDLAERMFNADIAVSGFGTTTYELMATRTPFIGVTRTSSEQKTANRVADYVSVDYFGKDFGMKKLTDTLVDLQHDPQKRVQLQEQYEEFIDGKGPERITKKLRSLV